MADLAYCPYVIGAPCLAPEAWAAWAQAILSAAAIYFAALAATAPDKLARRRKASSYLALLDIADEMLTTYGEQLGNIIFVSRLNQVVGQFAEVNVENIPDYRLLKPMQETHSALIVMSEMLERRKALRSHEEFTSADRVLKEMSIGYRDLLRARKPYVRSVVDEIAPQNWFVRLARRIRKF